MPFVPGNTRVFVSQPRGVEWVAKPEMGAGQRVVPVQQATWGILGLVFSALGQARPQSTSGGFPSVPPAPLPPVAPVNLVATAANTSISLTWSLVPGTSYTVYRSTTPGGETRYVPLVAANSYKDGAVVSGTTYYYKVTATGAGGESAKSAEASASVPSAPLAPTALAVANVGLALVLTWTDPPGSLTSRSIYRGTSSGAETLLTTGLASPTYTDSAITEGNTYYYKVSAVNAIGEGAQSSEASGKPPLTAIGGKLLWLDAGRQGGSDGVRVTGLTSYDPAPNNSTGLYAGLLYPTYRASGINSLPAFDFLNDAAVAFPSVFPATGSHTVALVVQFHDVGTSFNSLIGSTDNTGNFRPVSGTDLRVRYGVGTAFDPNPSTDGGAPGAITANTPQLLIYAYDATLNLANVWVNGKWLKQTNLTGIGGGSRSATVILGNANAPQPLNALVAGVVILDHSITPQELYLLHQAWKKYGFTGASPVLVYDGASQIDEGNFYSQTNALLLTPTPTPADIAQAGASIETCTASQVTGLFPKLNLFGGFNCALLLAGNQDIRALDAASDIQNDFTNYSNAAHNAGFFVIGTTLIDSDYTALGQSIGEAIRATVNAWMVVNVGAGHVFDAIADLSANANLGAVGARLVLTYFDASAIHWTTTGAGVGAGIAAPAANTFMHLS